MGITDNRSNTYAGSNDQNLDKVLICHVNAVMSTLSRTDRSVGNSVVEVEVLKKLAMTGKCPARCQVLNLDPFSIRLTIE